MFRAKFSYFLFGVSVLLCLQGCQDSSAPLSKSVKQAEAEIAIARAEAELAKSRTNVADSDFGIQQDEPFGLSAFPASLLAQARALVPDEAQSKARFIATVEALRESDPWLDESLKKPLRHPLIREDGSLPGPTTLECFGSCQRLLDLMLKDYLENSDDSEAAKETLTRCYRSNLIPLLQEQVQGEDKVQTQIFSMFKTGEREPLVLFLNLLFSLNDHNRLLISNEVAEGLRSRPCSPVTIITLVAHTKMQWSAFERDERIALTRLAVDAIPGFYEQVSKLEDHDEVRHWAMYLLSLLRAKLSPSGQAAMVDQMVRLWRTGDAPAMLDEYQILRIVGMVLGAISTRARGTDFISEVATEDYRTFIEYAELESRCLMKAFALHPRDSLLPKRLLGSQLSASTMPYSVPQLYRIACLTQCDSHVSTRRVSQYTQPRWGGSRRLAIAMIDRLMEAAASPAKPRPLFHIPMKYLVYDYGLSGNLHRRLGITDRLTRYVDQLTEAELNPYDQAINGEIATFTLRLLWDAGEIERFTELLVDHRWKHYGVPWLHWVRLPVEWYPDVVDTSLADGVDLESLRVLQQELLVGDEHYDEARFERIQDALTQFSESTEVAASRLEEKLESESGLTEHQWLEYQLDVVRNLPGRFQGLLQIARDFHDGKEVELLQGRCEDWCIFGESTISLDGDLIGIRCGNRSSNLLLEHPLRFALPMTVEMTVEQGECDADPYGMTLFAGPVNPSALESKASGRSLRYSPGFPMIMQDRLPREALKGEHYHEERLIPVPKSGHLRIEMTSDSTRSFLNDRLITETNDAYDPIGVVGFGRLAGDAFSGVPDKQSVYRVTGFKVIPGLVHEDAE